MKKILYFSLVASCLSATLMLFFLQNNSHQLINSHTLSSKIINHSYTIKNEINSLYVGGDYAGILNDAMVVENAGDNLANATEITDALYQTLLENIDVLYTNLNQQNPDIGTIRGTFDLQNRRISNNGTICADIRINANQTLINVNPDVDVSAYEFPNFNFEGFDRPIATQVSEIKGINAFRNLAPHQLTTTNFKDYLQVVYTKIPYNTTSTPTWTFDNLDGSITINKIETNKYFDASSYNVIHANKIFSGPWTIDGFRKAVQTNIENVVFEKNFTVNDIKQYLIDNYMSPLDYSTSQINIISRNDNYAIIELSSYYNVAGDWITSGQKLTQRIILNSATTTVKNNIDGSSIFRNYSSPYEIKEKWSSDDYNTIEYLKTLIATNVSNTFNDTFLLNDDIVIRNINDINIEGAAKIEVDFDIVNNGQFEGVEQPISLSTTIINLNYKNVEIVLKNGVNISNKAADYITADNWQSYIEIKNPLYQAEYTFNSDASGVYSYRNGIQRIVIKTNKKVNNQGIVEFHNPQVDLSLKEITGFFKVPELQFGWKDSGAIPYTVTVNSSYLLNNFVITNASIFNNIRFKNDLLIKPTLSNFNYQPNGIVDQLSEISFSFDVNNYVEDNQIVEIKDIIWYANTLPTNQGIFYEGEISEINNDNVYGKLLFVTALQTYFNIRDNDSNLDIKSKLAQKQYYVEVNNNNIVLYHNNVAIGSINKPYSIENNNDNNLLKILVIVLIVVGSLGLGFIIFFIISFTKLSKKKKT